MSIFRRPKGTPAGGRFAANPRAAAPVSLGLDTYEITPRLAHANLTRAGAHWSKGTLRRGATTIDDVDHDSTVVIAETSPTLITYHRPEGGGGMDVGGATYRAHRESGSILVDTPYETVVFTPARDD